MTLRYSQGYFLQHKLMNVSFRNLNEIIHPNAENIPEYIRHMHLLYSLMHLSRTYASAVFVNASFWNHQSKILSEIQYEGNRNDYINSYMNFVDMQHVTYNLVTKGKFL